MNNLIVTSWDSDDEILINMNHIVAITSWSSKDSSKGTLIITLQGDFRVKENYVDLVDSRD